MDFLDRVDPIAVLGWAFMAIATLRAGLDGLERIGKVPGSLKRWTKKRAAEIADERARETALRAVAANAEALNKIAENSATILAAVTPNGGFSMHDALRDLVNEMREVREQIQSQLDEHHSLKRTVEAHINLNLDGPGQ